MTDLLIAETAVAEQRKSILVVEDDIKYCRLVEKYLSNHGYDLTMVHNGTQAVGRLMEGSYDAVILDVMLPGIDGFEVLRLIRQQSDVPVLMLSALGDEADRIVGLELGADDYVPKSFSPRELLARLRAVTRRFQRATIHGAINSNETLSVGGKLIVHLLTRKVFHNEQPVRLTAVEFDLLVELIRAKGRIKTREQLLLAVRDAHSDSCDRSVDVHISALRRKLGDDAKNPTLIKTIRSIGYMLVDPSEPDQ